MSLIEILYIDQYIAVINKAPGLLSVPFPGFKGKTAQSVLEDILRKQGRANSKHHPFAVHRLDRDTSGVMMFALTAQAQKVIMDNRRLPLYLATKILWIWNLHTAFPKTMASTQLNT